MNIIENKAKTSISAQIKKHRSAQHQKAKWAIFTYGAKETESLKDTQIKEVFRTINIIQNIVKPRLQVDRYKKMVYTK
jgi:hypothetical protein